MKSSPLHRRRVYKAKNSKTLLFFICPFGTKFWAVRLTIKKLQRAGYTVVAYDTNNDVLYAGDPTILITIIDRIAEDIKLTLKEYSQQGFDDFGFFGSSLGGFIAYNCMSRIPELRWGVFNTGGNIAEAMWRIKGPRQKHQEKGVTKEELAKAWHFLQFPRFTNLNGHSYIFFSSPSDKIAPITDIGEYAELMRKAGATVDIVSTRAIGHSSTAVIGFRRSIQLLERVRQSAK